MRKAEAPQMAVSQTSRIVDSVITRSALLKKPLLSLSAYEVSCRVRVEKTTRAPTVTPDGAPVDAFTPKSFGSPAPGLDSASLYKTHIYYSRIAVVFYPFVNPLMNSPLSFLFQKTA